MATENQEKSKSSRSKVILLAVGLVVVLTLLFRGDQNPEIPYNAIDGKAMVLELQRHLKASEDLDNGFLPVDIHADPKIPTPLYSATIVKYDTPKYPLIVRWFLRLIQQPVEGAHLDFDRQEYAFFFPSDHRSGFLSTQKESRLLHNVTAKNFPNVISGDQVAKESEGLKTLEPNSHLRLHSDFLMIETKGQTRVYLLDQLPANVNRIYERAVKSLVAKEAANGKS